MCPKVLRHKVSVLFDVVNVVSVTVNRTDLIPGVYIHAHVYVLTTESETVGELFREVPSSYRDTGNCSQSNLPHAFDTCVSG